jgi:hypothetical protein
VRTAPLSSSSRPAPHLVPLRPVQCTPGQSCDALDKVWRVIVGLGVVPAILTYYLRTRLPETPRFTAHVEKVRG